MADVLTDDNLEFCPPHARIREDLESVFRCGIIYLLSASFLQVPNSSSHVYLLQLESDTGSYLQLALLWIEVSSRASGDY